MRCRGIMLTLALLVASPVAAQDAAVHVVQRGETLFRIAQRYDASVAELRALNGLTDDTIYVGQRLLVGGGGEMAPRDPAGAPLPGTPPQGTPTAEAPDEPAPPPAEKEDVLADVGPSLPGQRPPGLTAPDPIPTGPPPPPSPPATIARVALGPGGMQPIPTETPATTHVVQTGETLFALARRYGTTVDALRSLNALPSDALAVGQQLRVSAGSAPVAPARSGAYDVARSTVPADRVHVVRPGQTLYSIAARYGTTAGALLALNTVVTGPLAPGTVLTLPESAAAYHREPAPPLPPDEEGLALVYPDSYAGRPTISGKPYDPDKLTASHRTLPFGTVLLVEAPDSGRRTFVEVTDRGPVSEGFLVELSGAAAEALGLRAGAAERVAIRVVR